MCVTPVHMNDYLLKIIPSGRYIIQKHLEPGFRTTHCQPLSLGHLSPGKTAKYLGFRVNRSPVLERSLTKTVNKDRKSEPAGFHVRKCLDCLTNEINIYLHFFSNIWSYFWALGSIKLKFLKLYITFRFWFEFFLI